MDHRLLDYEQEFLNSYARLKCCCTSIQSEDSSAEKRRGIANGIKSLQQAESALRQFELQARMPLEGDVPDDQRSPKARADSYRRELRQVAHDFRAIRTQVERLMLLDDDGLPPTGASPHQRMRLLTATESAQKGVHMLESSRVLALETEVLGSSIMTELRGQRETIERTSAHMGRVGEGLRVASATIQRIIQVALRRKLLIYVLVALLILTLIFIFARKVIPGNLSQSKATDKPEASTLPDIQQTSETKVAKLLLGVSVYSRTLPVL
ncbi:vesicle transport v-snare protein [Besnoitia besnoiti]|uniref:Vesicle transport v-snare protein n=1 Tax=Besnoitia besnoiti TaxID=94643 RepID=A0A2A9LY25_BESBE|nr:vesicle transport v-snare protein [Besnoitia besnoiti]PFH31358.1 vesicle transport v-snare protein [Besnoitia besnoiti]